MERTKSVDEIIDPYYGLMIEVEEQAIKPDGVMIDLMILMPLQCIYVHTLRYICPTFGQAERQEEVTVRYLIVDI